MKFSQMPYERVVFETEEPKLRAAIESLKNAGSYKEAREAFNELETISNRIYTMYALAYIRYTINTEDSFYVAEQEYNDENEPRFEELAQLERDALLASPYRSEFENEFGSLMFLNMEMQSRTFKPEIIADLQEENKLSTRYRKLISSAQIPFDGKTLTLSQLAPYERKPDRAVRKAALEARAGFVLEHKDELDSIFDELVQVRTRIGKKLGYDNYIPLGYDRMTRNSYTMQDVAVFRQNIVSDIVPLAAELKAAQAKRLGIDRLEIYDEPLLFPDGNAAPKGTPEDIFAAGQKMYHELSPETAEFIDFMLENELFDVLSRKGKAPGGYCTTIADYKSTFIFANFNGTSDDIDVLTHEAGHAFADYTARDVYPSANHSPTLESCEIHSMSMEFFTWPWMESFFGENTAKYRYNHLASALTFIPYGVMVDEFQHLIYENYSWTPAERNNAWLTLEAKYRPWLDLEGFPCYGEGRRWQLQSHIFERPFYYIDYCLAQAAALEFWALMQKDFKSAWGRYMDLVKQCGTKTFTGLLETANIRSPFEPGTLQTSANVAKEWLSESGF